MKVKYTLMMLFILISIIANGQEKAVDLWNPPVQKGIKKLNIGDVLPDFKFNVVNDVKTVLNTSDFNDRLVIYDFGNTQCSGCVAALPHMASLEKQFGAKVKVLWVTPEPLKKMQNFWATNKYVKNSPVASILDDSTLRAYFPHRSWPHEAWVYKGKLIALTGPDYVDAANIEVVLSGKAINWPVKNDFYIFDGIKERLFNPDPNQIDTSSTFIKYAAISGYKEGVNSEGFGGMGIVRDPKKKTVRAYMLNYPISSAYLMNWMRVISPQELNKPSGFGSNQILWEVADKSRYTFIEGSGYLQDWLRTNGICFESLKPDNGQTDKEISQTIIADLNRLLGLQVRWEKRKEKVLVLVRTDKSKQLKSKGALTDYDDDKMVTKGNLHQLRDVPLSTIAYQMNRMAENPYVFDETGYTESVDLNLTFSSWKDVAGLRKSLQSYGLDLKEEERLVDKFVFSNANPFNISQ